MRAQKQGAKVAGLPIEPPIKLEFIINLKTAKTPVERRRIVVMSASLIGRLGSSAFRLSTNSSVDVAHGLALLFGLGTKGPSIMGIRRRGGTIFRATLPSM